jgi:hypothetical protein
MDDVTAALLSAGAVVVLLGYSMNRWAHSKGRKWR